jgi:hypothetical protein
VNGVTTDGIIYEGVAEFTYLGTLISNDDSVEKEIQKRILAGNRTYFRRHRYLQEQTFIHS